MIRVKLKRTITAVDELRRPQAIGLSMTLFRALLLIPLVLCIAHQGIHWQLESVAIIAVIVALDIFDGIAFRSGSNSCGKRIHAFRRVVDSSLDYLSVHLINVSVLLIDHSYASIFAIVLLRELFVSAPCVILFALGGIPKPNIIARASLLCVAILGIAYILRFHLIVHLCVLLCITSIGAFILYSRQILLIWHPVFPNSIKRTIKKEAQKGIL